jgi:hydroxylamine reductase
VKSLPTDTLVITAGDTKYRFYNLELGEIKGIPRLLDAGRIKYFLREGPLYCASVNIA